MPEVKLVRTAISNNKFSVDDQAIDAVRHLEVNHPKVHADLKGRFPELDTYTMSGSWFDTEAMGVDAEWGSWLVDAIEETGLVRWEDGEPWSGSNDEEID